MLFKISINCSFINSKELSDLSFGVAHRFFKPYALKGYLMLYLLNGVPVVQDVAAVQVGGGEVFGHGSILFLNISSMGW